MDQRLKWPRHRPSPWHNTANFWGEGPGKIRDAIVARNGRLARELYAADLADGERWAMQAITGSPDLENINLANLPAPRFPYGVEP